VAVSSLVKASRSVLTSVDHTGCDSPATLPASICGVPVLSFCVTKIWLLVLELPLVKAILVPSGDQLG
jgi:hypothetical protein